MNALYNALRSRRDSILNRVELIQGESKKWRALYYIATGPYKALRATGLPPSAAIALLLATIGGGSYVAADVMLEQRSFAGGSAGIYDAPGDVPIFYDDENQTLRVDLAAVPVGKILISSVSLGTAYSGSTLPTAESEVLYVGGLVSSAGFTGTYLEIGKLVVDRLRCTTMTMSDMEVHELIISSNVADGLSIAPIPGTPRPRAIGGGMRADIMQTESGLYDRLVIQAPASGVNGQVDELRLVNIWSKGGPCVFTRIKAGIMELVYSEFGAGDGYGNKDLIVQDTVIYQTFMNSHNYEAAISPPS